MKKINFNRILIFIFVLEILIFFFLDKTYSSDYLAYLKRYNFSHIYVFGDLRKFDIYVELFNRRTLSEYSWSGINFLRPKDIYGPGNQSIFFDLILLFFSNAKIKFDFVLNGILFFNAIILYFFLKKILNIEKYTNYSYISLFFFFLFVSNFFLEFYFIRVKTGLCFSFLFLSYLFFKKCRLLSILFFLFSFFIHPFFSLMFLNFIVLPLTERFLKNKFIFFFAAIISSIFLMIILYFVSKNIFLIVHKIHVLRMIAYTICPLIIFIYLIYINYNFSKIISEKFFITNFFTLILCQIFLYLSVSEGFSGEVFLRLFSFLSIPAIIYIIKINNISKSLMYNYIIFINFLFFFKSFFF